MYCISVIELYFTVLEILIFFFFTDDNVMTTEDDKSRKDKNNLFLEQLNIRLCEKHDLMQNTSIREHGCKAQ